MILVGFKHGTWRVWGEYKSLSTFYLQEVDEVTEHQPVEFGQRLNHSNGRHRVVTVTDTLLVEVHWDEWLLQLPIPQLHQGGCTWQNILLVFILSPNICMWTQKQTKSFKNNLHPSSPGTLGSERFSGILHWSTWSFSAFTSSMSPGTLKIKHNMSVTRSGHMRDLYLHHCRVATLPCGKTVTPAHPLGFKCGLVAESTGSLFSELCLGPNENRRNIT